METPDHNVDPAYDTDDCLTKICKFEQLPPQPLSASPSSYPGCCLALSVLFLDYIHSILPSPPSTILSIGSGYGLLEAFLLAEPNCLNIFGVEVHPSSNRYLPSAHHRTVCGSRFLDPIATQSKAWLFVYPKRVELVDEYIREYGDGCVEKIVWAGPMVDWEDYKQCFSMERNGILWNVATRRADEVGGRAWELIAVACKT